MLRTSAPSHATECVIVPVYVPETALLGMVMMSVGFHRAVFLPAPVWEKAVRAVFSVTALAAVGCPGVKVPAPTVEVAGPDQYFTLPLPIVNPVVVKPDELTVAVHGPALGAPRSSVTVMVPIVPVTVPPVLPEPRNAVVGTAMESTPGAAGARRGAGLAGGTVALAATEDLLDLELSGGAAVVGPPALGRGRAPRAEECVEVADTFLAGDGLDVPVESAAQSGPESNDAPTAAAKVAVVSGLLERTDSPG